MNTVEQIYNSIVTINEAELTGWQRLKKIFDPSQNDFRNIQQGWAIRHGGASTNSDATQVFNLTHSFELILTNRAAERDTDLDIQTRIHELYTEADDLFKQYVLTKLSLPFVTLVGNPSFAAPEVLENGCIVLTMGFDVNYYIDPY